MVLLNTLFLNWIKLGAEMHKGQFCLKIRLSFIAFPFALSVDDHKSTNTSISILVALWVISNPKRRKRRHAHQKIYFIAAIISVVNKLKDYYYLKWHSNNYKQKKAKFI